MLNAYEQLGKIQKVKSTQNNFVLRYIFHRYCSQQQHLTF